MLDFYYKDTTLELSSYLCNWNLHTGKTAFFLLRRNPDLAKYSRIDIFVSNFANDKE